MRQNLTKGSQFLPSHVHKDVQQNFNKWLLLRTREGFRHDWSVGSKSELKLLFEVAGIKNTLVFVK